MLKKMTVSELDNSVYESVDNDAEAKLEFEDIPDEEASLKRRRGSSPWTLLRGKRR